MPSSMITVRLPAGSDWMTPRAVSACYPISEKTLANWRWQGSGPPYSKLSPGRSGRVMYRRADVESFLAAGLVETH